MKSTTILIDFGKLVQKITVVDVFGRAAIAAIAMMSRLPQAQ